MINNTQTSEIIQLLKEKKETKEKSKKEKKESLREEKEKSKKEKSKKEKKESLREEKEKAKTEKKQALREEKEKAKTEKKQALREAKTEKIKPKKNKTVKKIKLVDIEQPITDEHKEESSPGINTDFALLSKIENSSPKNEPIPQKKPPKKREPKNNINTTKQDTSMSSQQKISLFKTKGISILENASEEELVQMIQMCNDHYYNTNESLLSDSEYDILKEYMEKKYPKNQILKQIGEQVKRNKVSLPFEMASMDKIKPDTNALSQWKQKFSGPYVLSCKLDGVSGLLHFKDGVPKLYTRGDGKIGQDISHFIKIMKLPNLSGDVAIRGEFIIPKKVFEEKYKNTFANPRNLVSGIINSKTIDAKAKDLHFVTYEVIYPPLVPSEQLKQLQAWNQEVVQHKTVDDITNESLSEILLEWRSQYDYEIDGIIVTNDKIVDRISGNPEHTFAFKMVISDQLAEAKVVDVIWTPSKNGYLKPRVRIEPIRLSGVTIEYATGFNGKFIEENKIGIGAVIQIIRSGDVIPHIKSVTTPAETAKMPDVPYTWTDTHVDIILENVEDDITVREKSATQFFVFLKVDGLSIGNVNRLFEAGFDTVAKIIKMSKADFEKVEGFKTKMAEKIHTSIHAHLEKATLLDIMVASNKMGRGLGERKIKPILEAYPDILTSSDSPEVKQGKLLDVKGIGKENSKEFVQNIPGFLAFLKECDLEGKLEAQTPKSSREASTSHPLYKKKIVMTKIRDKEIIDAIEKNGGTLENSMTQDVFALIVKSKEDKTVKTDYAVKHNIPIMTPEEFREAYLP
jgi:NAD-dependent DNA ligase